MNQNIYQLIIIGYLLIKAIIFFKNQRNIFKALGYKYAFVDGNIFVIKKFVPLDFSEDGHIPFTFFQIKKAANGFNEIQAELAAKNAKTDEQIESELKEKIEIAKKIVAAGIVRFPDKCITVDDMFKDKTLVVGWKLYQKIIDFNAPTLTKIYLWTEKNAIALHQRAKTYSTDPAKLIDPRGKLTDIEACIFNDFVYGIGLGYDNERQKKLNLEGAK